MIHVNDVTVCQGTFSLSDIQLSVETAESLALLGPSGSGKTLLLETMLGLRQPQKGSVSIDGKNVLDIQPESGSIAYLPQDLALFPHLSVYENIAFCPRIKGRDSALIHQTVTELASKLAISHLLKRESVGNLSGGEQQRVALARALAAKPKTVFLDEPFSALDGARRRELHKEVNKLHKELGFTLVFVTHDLDEAVVVGNKVALICNGKIIQTGIPSQVFAAPATPWAAHFLLFENIAAGPVKDKKFQIGSTSIPLAGDSFPAHCWLAIKACSLVVATEQNDVTALKKDFCFRAKAGQTYHYGQTKVIELLTGNNDYDPLLAAAPERAITEGTTVLVHCNRDDVVFLGEAQEHDRKYVGDGAPER